MKGSPSAIWRTFGISMKRFRSFAGNVTSRLEIDPEIFPGDVKTVITGDNEVRITNHKGLIEYSREKIRVNTPRGTIAITGRELEINIMTNEELVVSGVIEEITKPGGDHSDK